MIINISRGRAFQKCRQYAWNWDELGLVSHREADPLIVGEGYHLGSEIISKTADVHEAVASVEKRMRERYAKSLILPEEKPDIERNIEWSKRATELWAENYDKADFRVLWPEVHGCVELPGTEHHCWFAHRLLSPTVPFDQCEGEKICWDFEGKIYPGLPKCVQPHRLIFRTDGVIEMYKAIFLLEQKTTSSTERNSFWKKFQLDQQIRGYIYGIWKSTGLLVNGVLINAIIKHHKQITVNGKKKFQLDPTNIGFEREPVLITKEDVLDFEKDIIRIADEYELAFRTGNIYKNTDSCFEYNRECYYFELCKRHNVQIDGEFRQREPDYAQLEYYNVLGITPPPTLIKEITPCNTQQPTNTADQELLTQSTAKDLGTSQVTDTDSSI